MAFLASRTSVRAKFLAVIIPIALAAMVILYSLFELQTFRLAHNGLHEKLLQVSASQSVVLAKALWNIEDEHVEAIAAGLIMDGDVSGVAIYDASDELVYSIGSLLQSRGSTAFKIDAGNKSHRSIPFGDAFAYILAVAGVRPHPHRRMYVDRTIEFKTDTSQEVVGRLIVELTLANILRLTRERLLWDGILALGLVLAVALAAFVAYKKAVEVPLSRLLAGINTAKDQKLFVPVKWESNDEMGIVVAAFNEMQATLDRHEASLRRSRDELEDEVGRRTAELRIANEVLQEREAELAAVIGGALDGIITIDDAGVIIAFNPAAGKIFGYDGEEMIGQNVSVLVPEAQPGDHDRLLQYYLATGETKDVIGSIRELEGLRKDGSVFPIELAVSEAMIGERRIFVGMARDVSERKAAEKALHAAKEQAEAGGRAKAEFLAVMSHEIRTPLNGVLGLLGLLRDMEMDEEQTSYVHAARTSAENLLEIINDALDFSKIDAGRLRLEVTSFELSDLVLSVAETLSPRADGKSLQLSCDIASDVPAYIAADPGRIRQVLLNLADNAIKFTEQGSVTIAVSRQSMKGDLVCLEFQVADTGIGIAGDKQASLFDPFTTVDPSYSRKFGGTGLGLAISKKLVELMGGSIAVASVPGKGSTFTFSLAVMPSKPEIDDAGSPARPERPVHALRSARILLAEDNAANSLVAKVSLESAGHQVDIVGNGIEATEAARNFPYDLILMDVSMPEMDGLQATARIRALSGDRSRVPIIALTAHAMKGDREKFLAAGMDDYIAKPVKRDDMLRAINKWAGFDSRLEVSPGKDSDIVNGNPLDTEALAQLLADTDAGVFPDLISSFLTDAAARKESILAAVETADFETLEYEAHTLGSSAKLFGARQVHELAREVEISSRERTDGQSLQLARLLTAAIDACCDAFHDYLHKFC